MTHRLIEYLARTTAIIGGLVLTLLVLLVCVSVAGRGGNTFGHWDWLQQAAPGYAQALLATGIGPVNGDYELVEAGIAFAIFSFLPLCQLHSGHATVDVFTAYLPRRVNDFLVAFWEVMLSALIVLITARLFTGMASKFANGETTFTLQFPVWWAYSASFAAACVASLVAIYCAAARVIELLTRRRILPGNEGAFH